MCDVADILRRVKLEVCPCIRFQGAGTRNFLLSVVRYGTTELADRVLSLCVWVNGNGTMLYSPESG